MVWERTMLTIPATLTLTPYHKTPQITATSPTIVTPVRLINVGAIFTVAAVKLWSHHIAPIYLIFSCVLHSFYLFPLVEQLFSLLCLHMKQNVEWLLFENDQNEKSDQHRLSTSLCSLWPYLLLPIRLIGYWCACDKTDVLCMHYHFFSFSSYSIHIFRFVLFLVYEYFSLIYLCSQSLFLPFDTPRFIDECRKIRNAEKKTVDGKRCFQ